ncbi:odorant receptor 288 [Nasonia vitripennis]|uniref:Odorant receptor n=1 Tax=Nasonia vitripennis TaxID=7425 RepID=A0A7M6UGF2_NASVI|nr:odorant receptor 288 [Nasonia vitripennis]
MKKTILQEYDKENQKAFDEAKTLITWNKYLMSALGLWPSHRYDFIFVSLFCYYIFHFLLDYAAFYFALRSFNLIKIIGATMENVTMAQIFLRLYTMRRYNRQYGEILEEFTRDFSVKNYKSEEERNTFLSYNSRSKFFIKIVVIFLGVTAILYFTKPLIRQLSLSKNVNTTKAFTYDLPYRIHLLYKITDIQTYIATYISRIPILYIIGFTQTAMDCLTLTVIAHLCGQLGVLSIRISNLDVVNKSNELNEIIQRHQKLIKIGLRLRRMYRLCLLGHFLGATIAICILVYQVLISIAAGQKTNLVTFFVFGFLNIFRLYTHCWVGEYLIHESINVSHAYYRCKWYKLPLKDQKSFIICIKRSQQPLSLMAGNFSHYSLVMFTNVMKSAMAYLSFLRNFI